MPFVVLIILRRTGAFRTIKALLRQENKYVLPTNVCIHSNWTQMMRPKFYVRTLWIRSPRLQFSSWQDLPAFIGT